MRKLLGVLGSLLILSVCTVFGQDKIEKKLKKSKLEHKWMEAKVNDSRTLKCFVAMPKDTLPAETIIIVHGPEGLSLADRYYADQLAKAGFFTVAPNFLPKKKMEEYQEKGAQGPSKKLYAGVKDYARFMVNNEQVINELDIVFKAVQNMPQCNGNISVLGFGWGGYQCFQYAAENPMLESIFVFYGDSPKVVNLYYTMPRPIYAFYAGEDSPITSQAEYTNNILKANNTPFDYMIYPGAQHDYMYTGLTKEAPSPDKKARKKSWKRLLKILGE